jgi:beta-galactosidase
MLFLIQKCVPQFLAAGRNQIKAGLLGGLVFLAMSSPGAEVAQPAAQRERVLFNADWRFIKNDPAGTTNDLSYTNIKAWFMTSGSEFSTNAPSPRPDGEPVTNVSYTQADFDDSGWRKLNLPHDWGVEGAFDQKLPGGTGRLPWAGVGWYRKHFTVPAADSTRKVYLEVDGAMAYPTVWLNGKFVGGWPYGYSSFYLDLTPYLNAGGDNVLAIRLDNPTNSSRWYPGGGIYRNVWLVKTSPVHVAQWGTYVTTPLVQRDSARVNEKVTVQNDTTNGAKVRVWTEIYPIDASGMKSGAMVASMQPVTLNVESNSTATCTNILNLKNPVLWSLKNPARYVAVTTVKQDGDVVDRYETPFGVRTIEFTRTAGFLLNGERVPINGVCDHHDLGPLGAAINVRGLTRQIELLKEMGCNAIRTSHNMPAPELLDLCDSMGMLVMDESFDCWEKGKSTNDYQRLFKDWHERDLRAELRRDRNHPSIIIWSVGNEVGEQGSPAGLRIGADLAQIVHSEDTTRYVSSADSDANAAFNGFATNMDVFGYNYKPTRYGEAHEANPNKGIYGSETVSTISSRGVYTFPVAAEPGEVSGTRGGRRRRGAGATNGPQGDPPGQIVAQHQMSSYDLYYPGWATSPETEFAAQERNPFVAGEFVWTGFDYLGEPTPWGETNDPSRSSYFGIIDLCGFKKDRFYLYQAHWRPDFPMAHILPHWNWPERVGLVTPVHVYTSGEEAELFLNGKSLGRKKKEPYQYRIRWDDVVYKPGTLKVVAYKDGKKWATDTVKTTGPAAKLGVAADRKIIWGDGKDLSYVTVSVQDKSGLTVPRSMNHLAFNITGPGEIAGVDDGDATCLEPLQAKEHSAFNGLCLVIVRATGPGEITLEATSPGLKAGQVQIQAYGPIPGDFAEPVH